MSIITALKAGSRPERVNVFLDDKFAFSLDLGVVAEFGLVKGMAIDEQLKLAIGKREIFLRSYFYSLSKFARRPHSKFEIKNALYLWLMKHQKKIISQFGEVCYDQKLFSQQVILKLEQEAILDERAFVQYVYQSKTNKKSLREIHQFLRSKGIQKELIDEVLEKDLQHESDLAFKYARVKFESLQSKNLEKRELNNKLYQHLSRKGFDFELIKSVVEQLVDSNHI